MPARHPLPPQDQKLIQIVDAALAEAERKSGAWLVCRKGCTQCCIGVFAINQLDALRLRHGMVELEKRDAKRAAAVRQQAKESFARLAPDFPGDLKTGILSEGEEAEAAFEELGNEEPCAALSPETGECELYAYRPMTCRVFGPPVRTGDEEALGVCELCYHGASAEEIAACEVEPDPQNIENKLVKQVEKQVGRHGGTIIAYCLKD